jgi:hypothetical protein
MTIRIQTLYRLPASVEILYLLYDAMRATTFLRQIKAIFYVSPIEA